MKLIKITQDHYVIVDDSEIKMSDWYYLPRTNSVYQCKEDPTELNLERDFGIAKITHSTQPLELDIKNGDYWYWKNIKQLFLQEVKELIGEVDVEKNMWYERNVKNPYPSDSPSHTGFKKGFELGYNQALEDNKDKKWTDEDVIYFVNKSRETGLTAEYLMLSKQSQTEWEVELIDGKLQLK